MAKRYLYRVLVNRSDQEVPYVLDSLLAATRMARRYSSDLYPTATLCVQRAPLFGRKGLRHGEFVTVKCIKHRRR